MRTAVFLTVAAVLLFIGDLVLNDGRNVRSIQRSVASTLVSIVE